MRPVSIGINTIRNVGLDLKIHLKEQFHSIILAMHGLLFFRIVFEFDAHSTAPRHSANHRARNSKRKKVISLEGWVDIMYYVMDAHSFFSFIYFILLIVIGSFFMINLCLVVIATQFSETKQREQRLMEEARLKFMSNDSTLASYQDRFQNHISAHAFEPSRGLGN